MVFPGKTNGFPDLSRLFIPKKVVSDSTSSACQDEAGEGYALGPEKVDSPGVVRRLSMLRF